MEPIKKNFMYQATYQFFSIILPIVTAPYIARVLGKNGVGIYSYTYSIVYYFVLFAKLGIDLYGNRMVAIVRSDEEKLKNTFSEILTIHVYISIIVLMVYGIYVVIGSSEYKIINIIQALYIVAELMDINWFYFGMEKFKLTATKNITIKLLSFLFIIIFVRTRDDVWKYCFILAGSTFLSEAIMWRGLPQYTKFIKVPLKNSLKHLRPLIMLFIPYIAVSIYKVMDKIMLGTFADTAQVGLYQNAENITTMSLSLITALGTVMLPHMTNLAANGTKRPAENNKLIRMSMKFVMISSVGLAFGIAGIAPILAPVFYGNEFIDCTILLKGLSIAIPFTAFADVLRTQYLLPNGKDIVFQISLIAGALINFLFNYIFIPQFQAMGAVIGTILAEGMVCLIQSYYSRRKLPIGQYICNIAPYFINGAIMFIALNQIGEHLPCNVGTLVLEILLGVSSYAILSVIHLMLTKDELWDEAKKLIKIKKIK